MHERADVRGQFDRAGRRYNRQNVIFCYSKALGGIRMDLGPRVPDDLADRFGDFLQPGFVRAAPVIEKNVRIGGQRQRGLLLC
jgi:hypothetical protein